LEAGTADEEAVYDPDNEADAAKRARLADADTEAADPEETKLADVGTDDTGIDDPLNELRATELFSIETLPDAEFSRKGLEPEPTTEPEAEPELEAKADCPETETPPDAADAELATEFAGLDEAEATLLVI